MEKDEVGKCYFSPRAKRLGLALVADLCLKEGGIDMIRILGREPI